MTVRLERAALYADTAAALHGVPDAAELLDPMPVDTTPRIPMPGQTPTTKPARSTLLAAARILTISGWFRDAARGPDGALCLAEAVRQAAGGDREAELDALDLLLAYVRREAADMSETIPSFNARLTGPDHAVRILGGAANHR